MLRITFVDDPQAGPTIKLEGKLLGPWIEEVARAVTINSAASRRICLDLSQVTHADAAGAALLRSLVAGGVNAVRCSGYIARLIEDGPQT
jgi:ABC-type transporter Mla MlaB component